MRIPESRVKLLQSAEQEIKLRIYKTFFYSLKAFQHKVRNITYYSKERLTRKIFLHLKHKCLKDKKLRSGYKQILQEKSFQMLSKVWEQWKTYHVTKLSSQSLLSKFLAKKNQKCRVKAWDIWRNKFKAIDHDKKTYIAAVNHKHLSLMTKVFSALINNVIHRRNKHSKRLKSYMSCYQKQMGKMFGAWKNFVAKKLHLRELLDKRFSKYAKAKKSEHFQAWYFLMQENQMGYEAFFRVRAQKVFRCLRKIAEYNESVLNTVEKFYGKLSKKTKKRFLKSWREYTAKQVAWRNHLEEQYEKFLLSIKKRLFSALKDVTKLQLKKSKVLRKYNDQRRPILLKKYFDAFAGFSNQRQKYRIIFETITCKRARAFAQTLLQALKTYTKQQM